MFARVMSIEIDTLAPLALLLFVITLSIGRLLSRASPKIDWDEILWFKQIFGFKIQTFSLMSSRAA
jgi:hypothetical protein